MCKTKQTARMSTRQSVKKIRRKTCTASTGGRAPTSPIERSRTLYASKKEKSPRKESKKSPRKEFKTLTFKHARRQEIDYRNVHYECWPTDNCIRCQFGIPKCPGCLDFKSDTCNHGHGYNVNYGEGDPEYFYPVLMRRKRLQRKRLEKETSTA
jgi:hypothetical protein